MQVSTHDQDTPAANKQHKIEDQLPEYFNHGRILAPLAGIIPDLSFTGKLNLKLCLWSWQVF